jgi:hypothetical protein
MESEKNPWETPENNETRSSNPASTVPQIEQSNQALELECTTPNQNKPGTLNKRYLMPRQTYLGLLRIAIIVYIYIEKILLIFTFLPV